jgi:hypothetical protein
MFGAADRARRPRDVREVRLHAFNGERLVFRRCPAAGGRSRKHQRCSQQCEQEQHRGE